MFLFPTLPYFQLINYRVTSSGRYRERFHLYTWHIPKLSIVDGVKGFHGEMTTFVSQPRQSRHSISPGIFFCLAFVCCFTPVNLTGSPVTRIIIANPPWSVPYLSTLLFHSVQYSFSFRRVLSYKWAPWWDIFMKTYKMLALIPDWDDDPPVGIGLIFVIFITYLCM